jgi:SulP family sulfate permease
VTGPASRKQSRKQSRNQGKRFGKPTGRDVVAGLVTGLFSIPEGMAYASIGGFSPVAGLYSGVVPTIVGSLFARTVLMVTTLTSAIALSARSVLEQAGLDPADPGNIAMLVILVGVVMLLFGVLRLGSIMGFVSNAVMTGFTTGIAVQIVAGVLGDATGYDPESSNTIGKFIDWLAHLGSWDPASTVVAAGTIAVWALARLVKPLRSLATLVALAVVSVVVVAFHIDVEQVADIATIHRSLPTPMLPNWSAAPSLITGAVAVALVALAQAAGIGAAVPNPDGSRTDLSTDFTAQGLANVAGGIFQALPTGGSLSRTGVATSAGGRTRWAGIFAGIWLAVIVVTLGPYAELIPMPVIGGLLLVIGGELIAGRLPDIRLVLRTSKLPAAAMIVTFLATTQIPLQDAIFLGAGVSLLLFCVASARHGRLVALAPGRNGRWVVTEPPARTPSNAVTVLHYDGVSLFAEIPGLQQSWPDTSESTNAVIILSMRTVPDVPSSTVLKFLRGRQLELADRGNRFILAGVPAEMMAQLRRTGIIDHLDPANLYPARPELFGALDDAVADARRWIDEHRTEPDGG